MYSKTLLYKTEDLYSANNNYLDVLHLIFFLLYTLNISRPLLSIQDDGSDLYTNQTNHFSIQFE